jgi:hypothetical protein
MAIVSEPVKKITAMAIQDHSTIAEFRRRHERALGELLTAVLAPCGEAGWAFTATRAAADQERKLRRLNPNEFA